jgi:tight adherence protein B
VSGAQLSSAPLLAAVATAGAVVVLLPGRPRGLRARIRAASGTGGTAADVGPGRLALWLGASVLAAGALAVGAAVGGRTGAGSPAALVDALRERLVTSGVLGALPAVSVATATAVRSRRRTRRLADRVRQRRAVLDGVLVLAGELRAGTPALAALSAAAEAAPVLAQAAGAGLLGGDVAEALRGAGRAVGAGSLSWLAAAWTVSGEMGAALADTVDELVEILRVEDRSREEVESALASTRATARLLCVLPLAGLGLGGSIGAHPWHTLTGTTWGPAVAVVAVLLAGAGLEWVERLAASAEEPGASAGAGR